MKDKKVRAWDKNRVEYLYSDKFPSMWRFYKELENRGIRHFETEDYTGLKDKNGVDGYHKDILDAGFKNNWVIEWDDNQGIFYLKSQLGYDSLPLRKMKEMIIIGNINENPELLHS